LSLPSLLLSLSSSNIRCCFAGSPPFTRNVVCQSLQVVCCSFSSLSAGCSPPLFAG
jgi:hypothetical protein